MWLTPSLIQVVLQATDPAQGTVGGLRVRGMNAGGVLGEVCQMAPLPLPWAGLTHFSFGHISATLLDTLPVVWLIQPPSTPAYRDHSTTDGFPTHHSPHVPPLPLFMASSCLILGSPDPPSLASHHTFHNPTEGFTTFSIQGVFPPPGFYPSLPPAWNACSLSSGGSFVYCTFSGFTYGRCSPTMCCV